MRARGGWGLAWRAGLAAALLGACTETGSSTGDGAQAGSAAVAADGAGGMGGTGGGAATGGSAGGAATGGSAGGAATGGSAGGAATGGSAGGAATGGSAGGAATGGGADASTRDASVAVDAAAGRDAATTDAGAVDPLSTDRDAFFGDSRCQALGALFCDGFEGAALDAAWEKRGGGSATLDTAQKARGQGALHVHTDGNGFAYLRLTSIFPVADNRYWGRMFVRFDALPTAPDWAHWTIAEAAGSGDGSLIRVGGQWDRQRNRFGVGSDGGPTGDWTHLDNDPDAASAVTPEDEWICVEWLHDGANDVTRFFWDAVEHPSLATTASDHGGADVPYVMPQLESVWVGWWLYQSNPTPAAFDVWIDEVAFDDARIGCVR